MAFPVALTITAVMKLLEVVTNAQDRKSYSDLEALIAQAVAEEEARMLAEHGIQTSANQRLDGEVIRSNTDKGAVE